MQTKHEEKSKALLLVEQIESLLKKADKEGIPFMLSLSTRVPVKEAHAFSEEAPTGDDGDVLVAVCRSAYLSPLDHMEACSVFNTYIQEKVNSTQHTTGEVFLC